MKTPYYIFILVLFFVLSSSTCNNNSADSDAAEIREEIETMSESGSASAEGSESTLDMNVISNTDASDLKVGKKCGDDLKEYQNNVDKLLALSKKKAQGDDSDELDAEMKATNEKLKKLGKEMEKHPEIFTDPDCANAWLKMSTDYANYIRNNLSDFMPQK